MGEDGDTITVELPLSAAHSLIRAWNGDPDAIGAIATQHAINVIGDALDAAEAAASTEEQ